MPHFHLSVQSGDDMILKRMKRRHARRDTIAFCDTVRHLRPNAAFGADLIAGFPTESDAMFQQSVNLVDEAGLSVLHVFPFSARPGTPAARMPQLDKSLVKERAARLRASGRGGAGGAFRGAGRHDADPAGGEERHRPHRMLRPGADRCGEPGTFVTARITGAAQGHLLAAA